MKIVLNKNEIKELKVLAERLNQFAEGNIQPLLNETFNISKKAYIAGFVTGQFIVTVNEEMICEVIQAQCNLLDKTAPVIKAIMNLIEVATPALREFKSDMLLINDKYGETIEHIIEKEEWTDNGVRKEKIISDKTFINGEEVA